MIELYTTDTPNGWKAQIVLEEAGLDWVAHPVDLRDAAAVADLKTRLNPIGKLPVLVDPMGPSGGPIIVPETLAIARYASRISGELGARDAAEEVWFDATASLINTGLAMCTSAQFTLGVLAPQPQDWGVSTYAAKAYEHLAVFEALMTDGRDFVAGDRVTWLDALLWPHLSGSAERLPKKLDELPKLAAYRDRYGARAPVQRALDRLR